MSDDPKISGRYRELPREEPPRALDEAILAASRRAVRARPAPLVAPTGRRRWYVPVAAAAVITLAVAVTLHIQHDRPGEEVDAVSPAMKVQETPRAEAPRAAEAAKAVPEEPSPARKAPQPFAAERSADSAGALSGPAAAPAPASPPPAAEAAQNEVGAASSGARVMRGEPPRAQSQMARTAIDLTPETELERVARLRAAGRHEEADKALAEFRKRYPDYKIPEAMRERVERR
jgi:hypothetical protein